MFPFSWHAFLRHRISLTYNICVSHISDDAFIILTQRLKNMRPVLVCAFIRFACNSLPTNDRLHDELFASCPVCGDSTGSIIHIISCHALFSRASDIVRVRGGILFVSSGGGLQHPLITHGTPTVPSFAEHVSMRLGLSAVSLPSFRLLLIQLFVVQQAFTALRRSCCSSCTIASAEQLDAVMHAAVLSLA